MADWLEVTLGNVRWRVACKWRDALLDKHGLRLAEWQAAGLAEIVKQASHRTIHRVHLSDQTVYVKHYPVNDLRSLVRQLVRPSKGRSEFETALRLGERGVPTIGPLAFGETPRGESWLISLGLDAEALRDFIEKTLPALAEPCRTRLRFILAERLAGLLARMHATGVLHRDLHAGNILVGPSFRFPSSTIASPRDLDEKWLDRFQLYLIDLHAVCLGDLVEPGRPLDWAARRDNLVMLNRWFVQRSSRADRRRFWRHYDLEWSGGAMPTLRGHDSGPGMPTKRGHGTRNDPIRQLEDLTWQSCLRFWRRRDRRWLSSNRYVYLHRRNGCYAWAVRDLPPDVFADFLADPDAPLDPSRCKVLKHSRSSTVGELSVRLEGGERPAIYKRFMVTKWSDPWLAGARGTPALKSWLNGHRLRECGLPTARPLAVIHRRRGLVRESYLLTEKLPDAVSLNMHVLNLAELPSQPRMASLRSLIEALARLVRELHRRQFTHRDLKASNILIRKGETDAEASPPVREGEAPAEPSVRRGSAGASPSQECILFLIDLVGLERWRKLPRSRSVQNLARLNASAASFPWISRTEKLRFLRVYLQWGLKGKWGWKEWWRQVARKTQAKIRQNRARSRPLS